MQTQKWFIFVLACVMFLRVSYMYHYEGLARQNIQKLLQEKLDEERKSLAANFPQPKDTIISHVRYIYI